MRGVAGYVHGNIEDGLLVAAQMFRPAQGDVEGLLALDHLCERLAAHRGLDGVLDVLDADVPALALLSINGELEVGLALDAEDAGVLHSGHLVEDGLGILGEFLQHLKVWTDDLDRVVALDARERLHDVVADILREIPVDAGQQPIEFGVHHFGQFGLGASPLLAEQPGAPALALDHLGPVVLGNQRDGELDVVEATRIGAVVRPAYLRRHQAHLRVSAEDRPRCLRAFSDASSSEMFTGKVPRI